VYSGRAASFVDTGAKNGTQYRYAITAVGADGERSGDVVALVKPTATQLVRPAAGALVTSPPLLLWVPIPKASYYNVQLFRDGAKVLSIWPGSNHLALNGHWVFGGRTYALSPGVYRWYVWGGLGRRSARKYSPVLGSSTFRVSG
jgi:hypothetical protein